MSEDIGYIQTKVRELKEEANKIDQKFSFVKSETEYAVKILEENKKVKNEIEKTKRELTELDIKKISKEIHENVKQESLDYLGKFVKKLGEEIKENTEENSEKVYEALKSHARRIIDVELDRRMEVFFMIIENNGIKLPEGERNKIKEIVNQFDDNSEKLLEKNKKFIDKIIKGIKK